MNLLRKKSFSYKLVNKIVVLVDGNVLDTEKYSKISMRSGVLR